jgi:hypothetical protein
MPAWGNAPDKTARTRAAILKILRHGKIRKTLSGR